MKKIIALLTIICSLLVTENTNAQSIGSLKKKASETVSSDKIATYKALLEKPEIQTKVKNQLINNESLRTKAMSFLKTEPSVKTAVATIIQKESKTSSNTGLGSISKSAVMTKLLSNPEILTTALGFVKNNPKILNTVMGLIGM